MDVFSVQSLRPSQMNLIKPIIIPADQVDIHLLRCQQLRLYILKAARALLSHQDKLRQILSQPAVVDVGPNPSGKNSANVVSSKDVLCTVVRALTVFCCLFFWYCIVLCILHINFHST